MNNKDKLPIGAKYLTNKERDERTKIKTGNQKKINNHTNKYTNKKKERKSTIYHINNSLFYEDDINVKSIIVWDVYHRRIDIHSVIKKICKEKLLH